MAKKRSTFRRHGPKPSAQGKHHNTHMKKKRRVIIDALFADVRKKIADKIAEGAKDDE